MFPVYADCFSRRTQEGAIKHISTLSFSTHIVAGELRSDSDLVEHHLRWLFKQWVFSILASVARGLS
jgi:hypothetical protein